MPEVRRLTRKGRQKFADYLQEARSAPALDPPFELLTDETASETPDYSASVEEVEFSSKRQAGEYLNRKLDSVDPGAIRRDPGLWSWLALFYFDQVCPADESGQRKVSKTEHYILVPDWSRYYRHLLATPWEIVREYPDGARVLLSGNVDTHGDFVEQLASRQEIITNEGLVETADHLYYDDEAERPKVGARSRNRPGNVRRLVEIKQQLDLTFDLYGMDALEILEVLPDEFDTWR